MSSSAITNTEPSGGVFATTHWSVVLSAQDENSPRSAQALEELCRKYWYPLYAYIRRLGNGPKEAEDLTQEFFARLLEKHYLRAVIPERGKFRMFLLMAVKRFLANEWDRATAKKRGGGKPLLSLEELAEQRYKVEPLADTLTPDRIYERRWALTVLDGVLARVKQEFAAAGKSDHFECLKTFLAADKEAIPYAEVAARLGVSEGAARIAVHRLRKRFREAFREEIANTVASSEEVEQEVQHLLSVLTG